MGHMHRSIDGDEAAVVVLKFLHIACQPYSIFYKKKCNQIIIEIGNSKVFIISFENSSRFKSIIKLKFEFSKFVI